MQIESVFKNNEQIPDRYTCKGENVNPKIEIKNIPNNTQSLSLIIDDSDAPFRTFTHWIVFNIPIISKIPENSNPGIQGINDFKKLGYKGPCPPSGTHHYHFKLYALNTKLNLPEGTSKEQLEKAMQEHIIDKAELIGLASK